MLEKAVCDVDSRRNQVNSSAAQRSVSAGIESLCRIWWHCSGTSGQQSSVINAMEVTPGTPVLWILWAHQVRIESLKPVLRKIRADFTERTPVQVVAREWFTEILCRDSVARVDWTFLVTARIMLRFPRFLCWK